MKKLSYIIALILFVSSCSPAGTAASTTESSTATVVPTATNTLTPTIIPSPTLSLPVSYQTPIPASNSKINAENVKDLQEVARYYGQMYFTAALSTDHKILIIRDSLGIDTYDYQTNKHLNHIDLLGATDWSDLQISADGKWVLVDQIWLTHFTSNLDYKIQNLNYTVPMKEGNSYREIHLSPDGHALLINELLCNNDGCADNRFDIISLPNMQTVYSWSGGYHDMHGQNVVFSPDGSAIATRIENQMIIWRTSDQTQIAAITNIQGKSPAVFSSDSSILAIGQLNSVQIWNVASGQSIYTIPGLCGQLQDPPQPVFLDIKRVVILECPGYNTEGDGKVSLWNIPDATLINKNFLGAIRFSTSRILYEEDKDQVTLLRNPRNIVGPWIPPNTPYTIQFLANGDLAFVQRDVQLRNMACTIKSNGKANCSENTVLGTDEQFYTYTWQGDCIQFYKGSTIHSGDPAYSVCWKGYFVNALDTINNLLFYTAPSSGGNNNLSNSVVIGLENNNPITAEWHRTEIEKVAFSGDKRLAAVCRRPGGILYYIVDRDTLILIDLSRKTVIYEQPFTCLGAPTMVLTKDGNRLIAADTHIGKGGSAQQNLLIMNTVPPIERKEFDIDCSKIKAFSLSPDETILTVACNDGTLRFLNPDTASEIYRLTNIDPDMWGLAFSKDGTKLAMASERGYISIWAVPPFSP